MSAACVVSGAPPALLRPLTLLPDELVAWVMGQGGTQAQGERVTRAVFDDGCQDAQTLPVARTLRDRLATQLDMATPRLVEQQRAADGTVKLLAACRDGAQIECALIPEGERLALCISTQVGCRMGCRFCRSGDLPFVRHLDSDELLGQWLLAQQVAGRKPSSLVFMGVGEPLDNLDQVARCTATLRHRLGARLSRHKITLSTVGWLPGLQAMGALRDVNLTISLHASDDTTRQALMPVGRRFPLATLMAAARDHAARGQRVTFAYVLLNGVNDSLDDAARLVALLDGLPCMVNLLPFNSYPGAVYAPSPPARVDAFRSVLVDHGMLAVVRQSRGSGIAAACGQLRHQRAGSCP